MFRKMESLTGIAAAVLLFLLMILGFLDVVGRNVFDKPLMGASELTEILLAGSIFFLFPSLAFRGEHIVVDLLDGIRTPLLDLVRSLLTAALGAALFMLMAWRLWVMGDMALGYADVTPVLGIALAPVMFVLSVLSAITALCFIAALFRRENRRRKAKPDATHAKPGQADGGIAASKHSEQ